MHANVASGIMTVALCVFMLVQPSARYPIRLAGALLCYVLRRSRRCVNSLRVAECDVALLARILL